MSEPIRVLHVVTKMDRAGLETMLMNYYRHINRDRLQFDFLIHRKEQGAYDAEILALGGRIFRVASISLRHFGAYLKQLRAFFLEHHEYRIVHAHLDALSGFVLYAAKQAGIPLRIAHSHNNRFDFDWKLPLRLAAKQLIKKSATHLLGCSKPAISFMFGHPKRIQTRVIPNAIECNEFVYSKETRELMRHELGLSDHFVVGHVGRFVNQKNHRFLLQIFEKLKALEETSVLLLIGNGKMEASIRKLAEELNIADSVWFLGQRKDIDALLQAFDVFVMPSHYEGLGIAGVEAQAAGLPVVFSDKVPIEVKLTENATFLSLKESPNAWAHVILAQRGQIRLDTRRKIVQGGYDIHSAAHALEKDYIEMYMETLK